MRYLVYITEQCEADAKKQGLVRQLTDFRKKIEAEQDIQLLDRFPRPFLKKVFGQYRLIVEERLFAERATVLCFVRLFVRSDHAYEPGFTNNPTSIQGTYRLDDAELAEFVDVRLEEPPPPSSIRPMEETERIFLERHSIAPHSEDGVVYETATWRRQAEESRIVEFRSSLAELVQSVLFTNEEDSGVEAHEQHKHLKVLFRRFKEHNCVLLLTCALSDDDIQAAREEHRSLLSSTRSPDMETLLQVSRRAYPAIMALDADSWMAMQGDQRANLAFSPEEAKVLDDMRLGGTGSSQGETTGYPLFINGRPGSGKSTVLQYLFADLAFQHLFADEEHRTSTPPLYLTYNPRLLKEAQAGVGAILRRDAQRSTQGQVLSEERVQNAIQTSFGNLKDFLRSQLPDAAQRLPERNYVTFQRFKRAWKDQFRQLPKHDRLRVLGPEVCWHVIRSYIKGRRSEDGAYFDLDQYAEYPSKRKSVTAATFREIEDRVFRKWYEPLCQSDGLWDDQDLAFACMETRHQAALASKEVPRFPALFCDEAQDFTSIELRLILDLCLYTRRIVPTHYIRRIPLAFAGDPFQTLNPSGFSWESVRDDFNERAVAGLHGPEGRSTEFSFKELSFNYRSTEGIVRLCNSIHMLRGLVVGNRQIVPQRAWFSQESKLPAVFVDTDSVCRKELARREDLIILVPCHEGGEQEFVELHPSLQKLSDAGGSTILSPMSVKGLEYGMVVLYGFGATAASMKPIKSVLSQGKPLEGDREEFLEAEYFFNQLYVAASRATRRLIVVDTPDGLQGFWSHFMEKTKRERMFKQFRVTGSASTADQWAEDDLGVLLEGDASSWSEQGDDPIEIAERHMKQGTEQQDPMLLADASRRFEQLGDHKRSQQSAALAHKYSGRLSRAGSLFAELGEFQNALECLWTSGSYKEICDWPKWPEAYSEFVAAARYMINRKRPKELNTAVDALKTVKERIETDTEGLWRAQWQTILKAVFDDLDAMQRGEGINSEVEWGRVAKALLKMSSPDLVAQKYRTLTKAASLADDSALVVEIWGLAKVGGPEPEEVVTALGRTLAYPENVKYLHQSAEHSAVVDQFLSNELVAVSTDVAKLILSSFSKSSWQSQAIRLLRVHSDANTAFSLLSSEPKGERRKEVLVHLAVEGAHLLLLDLEQRGRWSDFVQLVQHRRYHGLKAEDGSLLSWVDDETLVRLGLELLARSDSLAQEVDPDRKQRVLDLLRHAPSRLKQLTTAHRTALTGAVFERYGSPRHIADFYWQAANRAGGDVQARQLARERWLKIKTDELEHAPEHKVGALRDELQRHREIWQMRGDKWPNLPSIPKFSHTELADEIIRKDHQKWAKAVPAELPSAGRGAKSVEAQPQFETGAHKIRCNVVRAKRRVEFRDDAEALVILDAQSGKVTTIDCDHEDRAERTWWVPGWSLMIQIVDQPEDNASEIRVEDENGRECWRCKL